MPDQAAQPDHSARDLSRDERRAALFEVLQAFFADPSTDVMVLHDRLLLPDLPRLSLPDTVKDWSVFDPERARQTALWLVRHASDRRPAGIGLTLLMLAGHSKDAAVIRTVGLLRPLGALAVGALSAIEGTTPDLIWLAERSEGHSRTEAVGALSKRADPAAVAWLLRHAVGRETLAASRAREIAEATTLADVLEAEHPDGEIVDQACGSSAHSTTRRSAGPKLTAVGNGRPAPWPGYCASGSETSRTCWPAGGVTWPGPPHGRGNATRPGWRSSIRR